MNIRFDKESQKPTIAKLMQR